MLQKFYKTFVVLQKFFVVLQNYKSFFFFEVLILSQRKEIQLFYFSAVNNNLEFDHDLITEDKYHHLNYIILVVTSRRVARIWKRGELF